MTKKKDDPAKHKRRRFPPDLGFMVFIEISPYVRAALAADTTWEALDLLERGLVTNLWHRPGKALHGSIALYSALLERDGLDTEPAVWETMEFFGVKRSTVFSARKYVLPVINRVLAHMGAAEVRKTLQVFDQLRQPNRGDPGYAKEWRKWRTFSQLRKSK